MYAIGYSCYRKLTRRGSGSKSEIRISKTELMIPRYINTDDPCCARIDEYCEFRSQLLRYTLRKKKKGICTLLRRYFRTERFARSFNYANDAQNSLIRHDILHTI